MSYSSRWLSPVPLLVDLVEIQAIGDDPPSSRVVKHAGEGVPKLEDEASQDEEDKKVERPPYSSSTAVPLTDGLGYQWRT